MRAGGETVLGTGAQKGHGYTCGRDAHRQALPWEGEGKPCADGRAAGAPAQITQGAQTNTWTCREARTQDTHSPQTCGLTDGACGCFIPEVTGPCALPPGPPARPGPRQAGEAACLCPIKTNLHHRPLPASAHNFLTASALPTPCLQLSTVPTPSLSGPLSLLWGRLPL